MNDGKRMEQDSVGQVACGKHSCPERFLCPGASRFPFQK